jgi:hypothetical protein
MSAPLTDKDLAYLTAIIVAGMCSNPDLTKLLGLQIEKKFLEVYHNLKNVTFDLKIR